MNTIECKTVIFDWQCNSNFHVLFIILKSNQKKQNHLHSSWGPLMTIYKKNYKPAKLAKIQNLEKCENQIEWMTTIE